MSKWKYLLEISRDETRGFFLSVESAHNDGRREFYTSFLLCLFSCLNCEFDSKKEREEEEKEERERERERERKVAPKIAAGA